MTSQQYDWSGAKLKPDQYYFDDAQKTPVRDIRYTYMLWFLFHPHIHLFIYLFLYFSIK